MSNAPKSGRQSGAPESPAASEPSSKRTKRAGKAGLANEVRPGLGTRTETAPSGSASANTTAHDTEPMGRNAPLPPGKPKPAPREQAPESLAHQEERDTGVSGHTSAD
jgi:hypothetical protein